MADRSKSEAIRRVLEAVPDIKAAQAREFLAEEGIEISLDLFRVVKKNWLRDRREQEVARRKYEEYWSPEAVERRAEEYRRQAEESARRQRDENERHHRIRKEVNELWLRKEWWEYWAWQANPIGPEPDWPEFPPTQEMYEAFSRSIADEQGANPRPTSVWGPLPAPVPAPEAPQGPVDGQSPALTAGVKEPIEESRCLTAQQKDDLVAEVVRQFTAEEWAEITDEYPRPEFARRAILADLLQDIAHGWTPEEAVTRVAAHLRANHA